MTPYRMRFVFRCVMARLAVCVLLLTSVAAQQQEKLEQGLQREAMKNFKFLVGHWSGEGEWFTANGTLQLIVTQNVRYEHNGRTLRIDERAINKANGKPVGFSIVGVSYDDKTGAYRVREDLPHSPQKDGVLGIDDDGRGLTIQFERPKLTTREVLRINEQGEWTEVHWVAPESETPRIFMRLAVRRQEKPAPENPNR